MGILGALFAGVSGLDVYASSIEVVGNNIANSNTAGFKASRAEFSDILASSLSGAGSSNQIGRGVQLSAVTTQFTQGSFESTSSGTDLAIDGSGFFIVRNNDGQFYTRAGQFAVNAQGLLVNSSGDRVQGVLLDTSGNPSGTVQDLNLTVTNSPPKVTSAVNFVANLDASSPALGTSGAATSGNTVTDRFQFLTGVNDVLEWNDSVANRTANLITNGGLASGGQYTAAQVATAIKTALEATNSGGAASDTYAVSYNASTKKFTVTNDSGNAGTISLRHTASTSTASDDLGFLTTSDDSIAIGASALSDNQVQFNVVTGRNTFTINLDGDYYATQKTATVATGGFTADGLAQAIETAINASDSADSLNRIKSVRVTYNAGSNTNKFQILSQTAGGARTVDIFSDSSSFTIPASSVTVAEASLGVLGLANMGTNETFSATLGLDDEIVVDTFTFTSGSNEDIRVDFGAGLVTVDLIANGGLVSGAVNTPTAVAAAIKAGFEAQNASSDVYTVTYDATARKFTIRNDTANSNAITEIDWADSATTAETILGFNATTSGSIAADDSTDVSDNATAKRILSLVTDGGLTSGAVVTPLQTAAAIKAALEVADVDGGDTYTVTYDSTADKYTITNDSGNTSSIAIRWTDPLTTANGKLGYTADDTIAVNASVISDTSLTTSLAAESQASSIGTGAFKVSDPSNLGSSSFSTSLTVFDSLGSSHSLNIFFRKIGENIWEYNGLMQGTDIVGPTGNGSNEQVLYGRLWFTDTGALDIEDKFLGATNPDGTTNLADANGFLFPKANRFNFEGGAKQNQIINFDFGTSISSDASTTGGLNGVTQFAGSSAIINQTQNGFTTGTLQSISVNRNGNVTGQFTNGQTRDLARIILANFNSPQGLSSQGSSLFSETQGSGQPILGQATTAGFGGILSNSIELSNVDIAEEFVKLIQVQQAFQANARIISTTEDLLDEIVNLTR